MSERRHSWALLQPNVPRPSNEFVERRRVRSTSCASSAASSSNSSLMGLVAAPELAKLAGRCAKEASARAKAGVEKGGRKAQKVEEDLIVAAARRGAEFVVTRVLSGIENRLFRGLVDPLYEPRWVQDFMASAIHALKLGISDGMVQDVADAICFNHKHLMVVTGLGALDLSWWETPLRALRASILHQLQPADESFWYKLRSPVFAAKVALCCVSWAGVNRWLFVLNYLLINKRCEYQLLRFVCSAQLFRFLYGLLHLASVLISTLSCIQHLGEREAHLERLASGARPALIDSLRSSRDCALFHAPTSWDQWALLWSEVVRLGCIIAAFHALRSARGGIEQLKALETVCVDAADGKIDGVFDESRLLERCWHELPESTHEGEADEGAAAEAAEDAAHRGAQSNGGAARTCGARPEGGGAEHEVHRVEWTEAQVEVAVAAAYAKLRAAAEKRHRRHYRRQSSPRGAPPVSPGGGREERLEAGQVPRHMTADERKAAILYQGRGVPPELPQRDGGPIARVMEGLELPGSMLTCTCIFGGLGCELLYHFIARQQLPWGHINVAILLQSLACFPYVVFLVLPIEVVTHTAVTGYNRQGLLCERLTMREITECRLHKARWQQRREAYARRLRQPPHGRRSVSAVISALARLNPVHRSNPHRHAQPQRLHLPKHHLTPHLHVPHVHNPFRHGHAAPDGDAEQKSTKSVS